MYVKVDIHWTLTRWNHSQGSTQTSQELQEVPPRIYKSGFTTSRLHVQLQFIDQCWDVANKAGQRINESVAALNDRHYRHVELLPLQTVASWHSGRLQVRHLSELLLRQLRTTRLLQDPNVLSSSVARHTPREVLSVDGREHPQQHELQEALPIRRELQHPEHQLCKYHRTHSTHLAHRVWVILSELDISL